MNLEKLTRGKQVIAVVCNQWGDSGKGKLVDWLSEWADVVIRGTGGGNAGHTVKVGNLIHVLHTIPCGILRDSDGVVNIIGNGVAFDPRGVCEELDELNRLGKNYYNLRIAYNAKLILPQHIVLDRIKEARAGADKIGTTGRGIGPVYTDHYARVGLIVNDMLNPDVFRRKLKKNLRDKLIMLKNEDVKVLRKIMQHQHTDFGIYFDQKNIFDVDAIVEMYSEYGKRLQEFMTDTDEMARNFVRDKKKILLEGAQGLMLSVDYGTMPFVTSSDCSIEGLAKGSGIKEKDVELVLGVVKAPYMTRVGEGPFPTELGGEKSAKWCSSHTLAQEQTEYPNANINDSDEFVRGIAVRKAGGEYGATTGRPRRTGWLDLPLLRYALYVNGGDIALTKLQVFDGAEKIRICTIYTYNGPDYQIGNRTLQTGELMFVAIPDPDIMKHCTPYYNTLPGWKQKTQNIRNYERLPKNLRNLVDFIEDETGARVRVLSMGPERSQTIIR